MRQQNEMLNMTKFHKTQQKVYNKLFNTKYLLTISDFNEVFCQAGWRSANHQVICVMSNHLIALSNCEQVGC